VYTVTDVDGDPPVKSPLLLTVCQHDKPKTKNHSLVVPLYGTGWDRLDWDRLHRGPEYRDFPRTGTGLQREYRACPWDRDSLQRGYITCPWDRGQVSRAGFVQTACLYHVPVPNLSHWLSACPTLPNSGLGQV